MDRVPVGDSDAFHAVYHRYYAVVLGAVQAVVRNRDVAEEVTQEVFLALWRRPERYEPSRGELGAYLRLLGRSRAVDAWRSQRAGSQAQDRLARSVGAATRTTDEPVVELARRGRTVELLEAVSTLPAAQREALVLAYWGAMTSGEIASRTNVPVGTAKSRLRLALARLRVELDASGRGDALTQDWGRLPLPGRSDSELEGQGRMRSQHGQ